jgi:hypothetical protein
VYAVSKAAKSNDSELLKGWQQIAAFLGLLISAAQHWAKSGLPVTRVGQRVQASPKN